MKFFNVISCGDINDDVDGRIYIKVILFQFYQVNVKIVCILNF